MTAIAMPMRRVASNVAMCVLLGAAMDLVARPSVAVAGAIVIAIGMYELSPLKAYVRKHWCEGSCIGLMALPMLLGMTGFAWMVACVAFATVQQLLPPMRIVDVTLGVVIASLGGVILFAPDAIPAITQPIFLAAAHICG
jgi:predicted metal-binding membrane protein